MHLYCVWALISNVRLKINPQWHVVAILIALVTTGLRYRSILDYRALSGETLTVLGRIVNVQASNRVRVVTYAYNYAGRRYLGEITDRDQFVEGLPVRVTVAASDPAISTIRPDTLGSMLATSLALCSLTLIPMFWMWGTEFVSWRRKR